MGEKNGILKNKGKLRDHMEACDKLGSGAHSHRETPGAVLCHLCHRTCRSRPLGILLGNDSQRPSEYPPTNSPLFCA